MFGSFKQAAKWLKVKETIEKRENRQLLSGCGFVQNIVPYGATRHSEMGTDPDLVLVCTRGVRSLNFSNPTPLLCFKI